MTLSMTCRTVSTYLLSSMFALRKKQRKVGPDQKYDSTQGCLRGSAGVGNQPRGRSSGQFCSGAQLTLTSAEFLAKAGLGYLESLTHEMEVSSQELEKDFGCTKEET